jgi:hypothetical protein
MPRVCFLNSYDTEYRYAECHYVDCHGVQRFASEKHSSLLCSRKK